MLVNHISINTCIIIYHRNAIFPIKSTINSQLKTKYVKKITICVVKYFKFVWGYGTGKLTDPKSGSPIYTNFSLSVREQVHLSFQTQLVKEITFKHLKLFTLVTQKFLIFWKKCIILVKNFEFFLNGGLLISHSTLFDCWHTCFSSIQPLIHNQKPNM